MKLFERASSPCPGGVTGGCLGQARGMRVSRRVRQHYSQLWQRIRGPVKAEMGGVGPSASGQVMVTQDYCVLEATMKTQQLGPARGKPRFSSFRSGSRKGVIFDPLNIPPI